MLHLSIASRLAPGPQWPRASNDHITGVALTAVTVTALVLTAASGLTCPPITSPGKVPVAAEAIARTSTLELGLLSQGWRHRVGGRGDQTSIAASDASGAVARTPRDLIQHAYSPCVPVDLFDDDTRARGPRSHSLGGQKASNFGGCPHLSLAGGCA